MRAEFLEQPADALPSRLDGSCRSVSQQRLELGEHMFDRIEVLTVGRQEEQLGAGCADRSTHRGSFVAAEIVDHHDVASAQGRRQELRDVGQEAEAVDRPVEHTGRGDPVASQSGDEGQRLPMTIRHFVHQALPHGAPAVRAGHVDLSLGFIDEHQPPLRLTTRPAAERRPSSLV
jgi:hypothetical protein